MRQPRRIRGEISGRVDKREPWMPLPRSVEAMPPFDEADRAALIALRDGKADMHMQIRALGWIMFVSGDTDRLYRRGDEAFVLGRHAVGEAIRAVLSSPGKMDSEHGA